MESSEGLAIPLQICLLKKSVYKEVGTHLPQFTATYSTAIKDRQYDVYLKERRQTTAYPQVTQDHKAMIRIN